MAHTSLVAVVVELGGIVVTVGASLAARVGAAIGVASVAQAVMAPTVEEVMGKVTMAMHTAVQGLLAKMSPTKVVG